MSWRRTASRTAWANSPKVARASARALDRQHPVGVLELGQQQRQLAPARSRVDLLLERTDPQRLRLGRAPHSVGHPGAARGRRLEHRPSAARRDGVPAVRRLGGAARSARRLARALAPLTSAGRGASRVPRRPPPPAQRGRRAARDSSITCASRSASSVIWSGSGSAQLARSATQIDRLQGVDRPRGRLGARRRRPARRPATTSGSSAPPGSSRRRSRVIGERAQQGLAEPRSVTAQVGGQDRRRLVERSLLEQRQQPALGQVLGARRAASRPGRRRPVCPPPAWRTWRHRRLVSRAPSRHVSGARYAEKRPECGMSDALITIAEARDASSQHVRAARRPSRWRSTTRSAGCWPQDVRAAADVPPFPCSAMDGYA